METRQHQETNHDDAIKETTLRVRDPSGRRWWWWVGKASLVRMERNGTIPCYIYRNSKRY
ncbi:hypothetical protein MTR_0291s0030 [Medicago truncatula]|uniref:Uncharacterized protein n=1 Tax=Medicago truncatula TaxID=3880 RepID=A0A072TFK8_MEDTR|nr:hypothetical protein MTR_0291s0030 [Medicago truncatula]